MNIFTTGYELSTAITNIFIFIISLYSFIKIKDKSWKIFFGLMTFNSFFGVIAHGIVMSKQVNDLLWIILSITFTITINTLFCIIMKFKNKYILYLSLLLAIPMIIQLILDSDYLLTFDIYVIIVFIISIYKLFISKEKYKYWLLSGLIIQFIGGILMLCKVTTPIINHNGICHVFMIVALILFYIGIKKD